MLRIAYPILVVIIVYVNVVICIDVMISIRLFTSYMKRTLYIN